jgi:hypothetical protein
MANKHDPGPFFTFLHDPCLYLALAKLDEIPQPEPLVPALSLLPGLLDLPEDGALPRLGTPESLMDASALTSYVCRRSSLETRPSFCSMSQVLPNSKMAAPHCLH